MQTKITLRAQLVTRKISIFKGHKVYKTTSNKFFEHQRHIEINK